jgi:UDP-2,4-diacetamido-2,4,6-trideoxy-beta-L-altropyranose hydrolase
MKILFRVDSGSLIGGGHLLRCLNLARQLLRNEIEVVFACKNHEGNINNIIDKKIDLIEIPSYISIEKFIDSNYSTWNDESDEEEFFRLKKLIKSQNITHVIVDHYGIGTKFDNLIMKLQDIKYIVIDDIQRIHNCHYLLNQNFGITSNHYKESSVNHFFLGPTFSLLDEKFNLLRKSNKKRKLSQVRNILVFFGSNDPTQEIKKVLSAIKETQTNKQFKIIIKQDNDNFKEIKEKSELLKNVELHPFSENFANIMQSCEVAFGASGSTNWERCCLGIPTYLVTVAENQKNIAQNLLEHNLINYVGHGSNTTYLNWKSVIDNIDSNITQLNNISSNCYHLTEGKGTILVTKAITEGEV